MTSLAPAKAPAAKCFHPLSFTSFFSFFTPLASVFFPSGSANVPSVSKLRLDAWRARAFASAWLSLSLSTAASDMLFSLQPPRRAINPPWRLFPQTNFLPSPLLSELASPTKHKLQRTQATTRKAPNTQGQSSVLHAVSSTFSPLPPALSHLVRTLAAAGWWRLAVGDAAPLVWQRGCVQIGSKLVERKEQGNAGRNELTPRSTFFWLSCVMKRG